MNDAKFEIEIDELEDVLEEELHLYENTSLECAAEFLESFLKYLKHIIAQLALAVERRGL